MRKWIFPILVVLTGLLLYLYLQKPHRDVGTEEPIYVLSTAELKAEFSGANSSPEGKYLNKTILVKGRVTQQSVNSLVLDNFVFCDFQESLPPNLTEGDSLSIKGRVIGYDDLLEELKLDQSILMDWTY